jgi:broad specificity phosphatase PhoE
LVVLRRLSPFLSKERAFCFAFGFVAKRHAMAKQLLLVRHGAIDAYYDRRYAGRIDVPLNDPWRAEAEPLVRFVRAHNPTQFYCSPLLRARQTFELLTPKNAAWPMTLDDDLREVDFGNWEGRTWDEVAAEQPETTSAWWEFRDDFAFPGGESIAGFAERTRQAAWRLAADPAEVVLAVTHGGAIRMILCHLLGLPVRNFLKFNPRRGTCAVLERPFGDSWVLTGLNLPGDVTEAH